MNHSLNYLDRRRPDESANPVEVGEDCWLGMGATILPGMTIGKECVVAAGAGVAGHVTPFTLVGGVPAKFIQYLGNPEEPEFQNGSHQNGITNGEVELGKGEESMLEGIAGGDKLPNGCAARGTDGSETNLPRWLRTPPGSK